MPDIEDAISKAIELKQPEVLKNKQQLVDILDDLVPELVKERELLNRLYTDELGGILYEKYCFGKIRSDQELEEVKHYYGVQLVHDRLDYELITQYFTGVFLNEALHRLSEDNSELLLLQILPDMFSAMFVDGTFPMEWATIFLLIMLYVYENMGKAEWNHVAGNESDKHKKLDNEQTVALLKYAREQCKLAEFPSITAEQEEEIIGAWKKETKSKDKWEIEFEESGSLDNPEAICELAKCYYLGIEGHCTKDEKKALEMFATAADIYKYDPAYNFLGEICLRKQEYQSAYSRYKKAKNVEGVCMLGYLYQKGYGIEADQEWAVRYYKMAAVMACHKQDDTMLRIAYKFKMGIDVPQDQEIATSIMKAFLRQIIIKTEGWLQKKQDDIVI